MILPRNNNDANSNNSNDDDGGPTSSLTTMITSYNIAQQRHHTPAPVQELRRLLRHFGEGREEVGRGYEGLKGQVGEGLEEDL